MALTAFAASLWAWWKVIGKKLGDLQARFLLSLFYYVVLAPFALLVQWVDPLFINRGNREDG